MAMSRKGWIGIELGTRALKVAQVERAKGKARIAASAVLYRNDPAPEGESLGWSEHDLAAALALDPNFTGCKTACVLPMHRTPLHAFTIPAGDRAERRAMLVHEIAATASGNEADAEFDFWEVEGAASSAAAGGGNVCTMSVSRAAVSEITHHLSKAGLVCEVLDGLPFALARAVSLAYGEQHSAPVAAVDWGDASSTFCLIANERLIFTRHLRNCGLGLLVDAVRQALNVSEEDVRHILNRYGLPDPQQPNGDDAQLQTIVAEAGAEQLNEIAEELRKTMAYLRMQFAALFPQQICLMGAGAGVRNVAGFLSRETGINVELWRLPVAVAAPRPVLESGAEPLGIAVALSALAWVS
jgi:Tfp pilus assembly PilM family ATPase